MSGDYELLQLILAKYELTTDWLSFKIGKSKSITYKYTNGGSGIPTVVWRVLFAETRDRRIMELFVGDVPLLICDKPDVKGTSMDAIKLIAASIEKCGKLMAKEGKILEDGKVDKADRVEMAGIGPAAQEAITAILQGEFVLQEMYKAACNGSVCV